MKKLFTLLLTLISLTVFAQVPADVIRTKANLLSSGSANFNKSSTVDANLKAYLNLFIPKSINFTLNNAKDSAAAIQFRTSDKRFGVYNGTTWDGYAKLSEVTGIIDSSAFNNPYSLKFDAVGGFRQIILTASVSGWDQTIREIGNHYIENGIHYQLYTGYTGTSGVNSRAGIARSLDGGITYTKWGLAGDGKMFNTPAEDPHVIKVGNTYYLYSEESSVNAKKIQLHTSTDLLHWTSQGIVLNFDGSSAWNGSSIGSPMPIYKNGTFYLYYEGLNSPLGQLGAIGLATSSDGLTFVKGTDPVIVGKSFADAMGALSVSKVSWANHVVCDDITEVNGLYYMTFHGQYTFFNTATFREGMLVSSDLTTWSDFLGTFISRDDNVFRDIMFVRNPQEISAVYIENDGKTLIQNKFKIQNKFDFNVKTLSANGVVNLSGLTNLSGMTTVTAPTINLMGLGKYNTDSIANLAFIGYKEQYIDRFNLATVRSRVFNLSVYSQPDGTNHESGTGITYQSYAWGYGGFTNAVRFENLSGVSKTYYTGGTQPAGRYNVSFYVSMDDGSRPKVNQTFSPNSDFAIYIGNGYADAENITIDSVAPTIFRVSANRITTTSSANSGVFQRFNHSGKDFRVTGFQVTRGYYVEPYTATPTAPVTVVDSLLTWNGKEVSSKAGNSYLSTASVNGTANVLPKFIGANAIGDSQLSDDGTYIYLGATLSTARAKLNVTSTGTQLRIGYDLTNYTTLSTNTSGNLSISPTGAITTINGIGRVTSAPVNSNDIVRKTELDLKANLASPTFTGTVVLPSTTSIGAVSNTEISYLDNVTSAIQTQFGLKAPLASPALTGSPTAPTQSPLDNSTKLATTAYVDLSAIAYTAALNTINTTAVPLTKTTLNATYPTAPVRFKVIATTLGVTYEKYDATNWFSTNITVMP